MKNYSVGLLALASVFAATAAAPQGGSNEQHYAACNAEFGRQVGGHRGEGAFDLVKTQWIEDCVRQKRSGVSTGSSAVSADHSSDPARQALFTQSQAACHAQHDNFSGDPAQKHEIIVACIKQKMQASR